MLWHWPLERVFGFFDEAQGFEHAQEAMDIGKGLIVAAPHCGSWEMLNLYLHSKGEAAILYKPSKFPEIDAMLLDKRRRGGAEMVPATGTGLRRMFKLLKEGLFVALLPDQEPSRGGGQFAPFFGIEALTGVLLPRMARRTGAPVIFAVCERRKGGRYCVHLFKPDESIYSENMREALTAVNHCIEQCIEVDTEQYLWAYKRFRNRPEGEKSFYKR
jgi:KDO2-lipid IV(A) lauroyltransferase